MKTALRQVVGRTGEACARAFLEKHGYRVLTTSYRGGRGEIDIVAEDGGALVFVEVKSKMLPAWGAPAERVGWRKQRALIAAAEHFLAEHIARDRDVRFDVVAVLLDGDLQPLRIEHIPDAFQVEEEA
jgi:putative endonuclease